MQLELKKQVIKIEEDSWKIGIISRTSLYEIDKKRENNFWVARYLTWNRYDFRTTLVSDMRSEEFWLICPVSILNGERNEKITNLMTFSKDPEKKFTRTLFYEGFCLQWKSNVEKRS